MPAYATTGDVLRVLGGSEVAVRQHFRRQLWNGATTSVTVDDETFDVPDTILARIAAQIVAAQSKIDGFILGYYQTTPDVVPDQLRQHTSGMAAYHSVVNDGVRTQYLTSLHEEALMFMRAIRDGKVDLGIPDPRPAHIAPFAESVQGLGSTSFGMFGRRCRSRKKRGVYP